MNAKMLPLDKYAQRRSCFSAAALAAFHNKAVFGYAAGYGDKREGAYPMLSPRQAEFMSIADPIEQTRKILMHFHPGPSWSSPEFVDTIDAVLLTRWNEMVATSKRSEAPVKQLGGRFNTPKEITERAGFGG